MQIEHFYMDVLRVDEDGLLQKLMRITKPVRLNKGERLINEGEAQENFVFLLEGVLRGFMLDANGRDITDCFGYRCGTPVLSCPAGGIPSPISIEALTDCELALLPGEQLLALMQEETRLLWTYNELLYAALCSHWEVKVVLCQYTAMERYQWFLRTYPGLLERVRNKHVASFLGMTPVTLSRLRRTLREEERAAADAPAP